MSQNMNFSPQVVQLSGGELPPNSITLVYSPSCPHCHNIMPQYNQLPGLSGGKFSVNAVNLMDHYHELRAGGVQVGGVPQILIRGGSTELLEYNGPRMADSIAKEALAFMGGQLTGGETATPATPATPATESTDALLGGATPATPAPPATEAAPEASLQGGATQVLEGGKTAAPAATLEGGRKPGPKRGSHHRHHRRSRSRSRSRKSHRSRRSRHHHHHRRSRMAGGEIKGGQVEIKGGATPAPVAETTQVDPAVLEGGSRHRRRRHDHLSRWRNHVMKYAREHNMSLKKAMKKARASYYK